MYFLYIEKSAHRQFEGCVSEVAAAECIEYLLSDNHVKHEGLFRVPGNAAQVKRFLEDVDQGTVRNGKKQQLSCHCFFASCCVVARFGPDS